MEICVTHVADAPHKPDWDPQVHNKYITSMNIGLEGHGLLDYLASLVFKLQGFSPLFFISSTYLHEISRSFFMLNDILSFEVDF